jgi:hypothetical protein
MGIELSMIVVNWCLPAGSHPSLACPKLSFGRLECVAATLTAHFNYLTQSRQMRHTEMEDLVSNTQSNPSWLKLFIRSWYDGC